MKQTLCILLLLISFISSSVATDFTEVERLLERYLPAKGDIAPAVLVVNELVRQLEQEKDVGQALKRIQVLRRVIAEGEGVGGIRTRETHGDNCYANPDEEKTLFNAISTIETAAALADGHYSFSFCTHDQDKPYHSKKTIQGSYLSQDKQTLEGQIQNKDEQHHLTVVYAVARSVQAQLASPKEQTDLPTFVRRGINSRHLPTWMKEIYKRDFFDNAAFNAKLGGVAGTARQKLESLALYKVRSQQKAADKRKTFKTNTTPTHEMMAFAINPNHGCAWYSKIYDYGYEEPWDMVELLIDNLLDEPGFMAELLFIVVSKAVCFPGTTECDHLSEKTDTFFEKKLSITIDDFWKESGKEKDTSEKDTAIFKKILAFFQKNPSFLYEILDEIIQTSKANLSDVRNVNVIASLIQGLPLNQRPFIEWNPTGKDNEIELRGYWYKELAEEHPLLSLSHTYSNSDHATVLIPGETTPQTFSDWVKATQREQDTGITLTPTYISSWM